MEPGVVVKGGGGSGEGGGCGGAGGGCGGGGSSKVRGDGI
jgi:hypothetical protein